MSTISDDRADAAWQKFYDAREKAIKTLRRTADNLESGFNAPELCHEFSSETIKAVWEMRLQHLAAIEVSKLVRKES